MAAPRAQVTGNVLTTVFADLGEQPPSNWLEDPGAPQSPRFPLVAYVDDDTCHVQVPAHVDTEAMFSDDYVYFSSFSSSWLEHAKRFVDDVVERLGLGPDSLVVEVASNDGYLLRWFQPHGVPSLGIEPTAGTAEAARDVGVETEVAFFSSRFAKDLVDRRGNADLVVNNNVLAHQSDVLDYLHGIHTLLAPAGVATFEFPHLLRLVEDALFDTIYHEHYSYLSLHVVADLCARVGLEVVDVELLPTHGGSLRVHAHRADDEVHGVTPAVEALLAVERERGLTDPERLAEFADVPRRVRDDLRAFLDDCRAKGQRVAAYGAAAKATVLTNYAGITTDDVAYVVDRNPHKQGRLVPGSRLPIVTPEHLLEDQPDVVLVFPWNLVDEIREQMAEVTTWGGRFVTAIPSLKVHGE